MGVAQVPFVWASWRLKMGVGIWGPTLLEAVRWLWVTWLVLAAGIAVWTGCWTGVWLFILVQPCAYVRRLFNGGGVSDVAGLSGDCWFNKGQFALVEDPIYPPMFWGVDFVCEGSHDLFDLGLGRLVDRSHELIHTQSPSFRGVSSLFFFLSYAFFCRPCA